MGVRAVPPRNARGGAPGPLPCGCAGVHTAHPSVLDPGVPPTPVLADRPPRRPGPPHLQCTTMGPACAGLSVFTFFRNLSIPMGVKGTPKSGQLVKCSWHRSRGALQPSGSCCGDRGTCVGQPPPSLESAQGSGTPRPAGAPSAGGLGKCPQRSLRSPGPSGEAMMLWPERRRPCCSASPTDVTQGPGACPDQ